jgi:uncharacterized phage protein (TIGR02220 family)
MKNRIRKAFTQVPNDLINEIKLSRDSRFLFVYLCSKTDDWTFYTSKIETDLSCSKDSRIKYMKELISSGWITTEQTKKENGEWGSMEIILNPYPVEVEEKQPHTKKADTVKIASPKLTAAENIGSGETTTHNNKDLKTNTDLFSNTEITVIPISVDILKYLNKSKPSKIPFEFNKVNLSFIESRIKEKFKEDDFKKVIDHKISEWKDDPKMKKYIRPETLFGNKFNGYLVEAHETKSDGSDNFKFNPTTEAELL